MLYAESFSKQSKLVLFMSFEDIHGKTSIRTYLFLHFLIIFVLAVFSFGAKLVYGNL